MKSILENPVFIPVWMAIVTAIQVMVTEWIRARKTQASHNIIAARVVEKVIENTTLEPSESNKANSGRISPEDPSNAVTGNGHRKT